MKGSLSNDNDDGNENGKIKKSNMISWQNSNFVRAPHFFLHFFAVVARLRRENA